MSSSEIKSEIQKMLDTVPDYLLEEIFDYLKQVQNTSSDALELSQHLKKIFSEDKSLLQRLAE